MHIRSPEQFNVFQVKRIIEQLSPQRSFHVLVERLSSANKAVQQAWRHKRVLHERVRTLGVLFGCLSPPWALSPKSHAYLTKCLRRTIAINKQRQVSESRYLRAFIEALFVLAVVHTVWVESHVAPSYCDYHPPGHALV